MDDFWRNLGVVTGIVIAGLVGAAVLVFFLILSGKGTVHAGRTLRRTLKRRARKKRE